MITRHRVKESLIQWLSEDTFGYHLTFNFNSRHRLTIDSAKDRLCHWNCRVFRQLLGRRYYRHDQVNTMYYVAFPEYGANGDNLHLHAPCRVAEAKAMQFEMIAAPLWKQLVPSGSLYIQKIAEGFHNLSRVLSYDTKRYSSDHAYIVSTEFAPL